MAMPAVMDWPVASVLVTPPFNEVPIIRPFSVAQYRLRASTTMP